MHPGTSRWRLLAVCLALVANLVAAGVPVLHSLAHEAHSAGWGHDVAATHHQEGEHHAGREHHPPATHEFAAERHAAESDHHHEQAHAPSLHDECVALKRLAVDFAFLAPVRFVLSGEPEHDGSVPRRLVQRLSSRAPPPGDPARAPPPV